MYFDKFIQSAGGGGGVHFFDCEPKSFILKSNNFSQQLWSLNKPFWCFQEECVLSPVGVSVSRGYLD